MSEKEYTPKNILSLIALGAVIIFGSAMVTGCDEPTREERFERGVVNVGTPTGATNIEIIDRAWYSFEYKGQCFLATRYWRHAAMTKIDCEDRS